MLKGYIFFLYMRYQREQIKIRISSLKGIDWYEKYRQDDVYKYNEIYHNLNAKDLKALRKV